MKMLYDRVLILRKPSETKTGGGIIIPDTADKEKVSEGKIIAMGDGYQADTEIRSKGQFKPGDTVLFGRFAGSEIEIDDQKLLVMKFKDVIAVLEKKEIDW